MDTPAHSQRAAGFSFKRPFVIAVIVELLTLPPAILTSGHAGPEGPFALIGWLGVLVNLPGIFIVGMIMPARIESLALRAVGAFIINAALLTGLFILLGRLFAKKKSAD
jgi:hypothetical protein